MTHTKRLLSLLLMGAAFAWAVPAAEIEGVLMDKMCSMKAMNEGGLKAAAMHKRSCVLMPNCVKSGYGVVTADNKFLAFDAAGSSSYNRSQNRPPLSICNSFPSWKLTVKFLESRQL